MNDQIRVLLPVAALIVILALIFALQAQTRSYFGLTLLFSFSIPLVFAALAQMCIIAAGDIDLGIGPYISLVNCIAVTYLFDRPVLGVLALAGCIAGYGVLGALVELRRLPSIVVTLGASFVWLGLAVMLLPAAGGTAPAWLPAVLGFAPPLVPLPILVAIVVGAVAQWLLFRTSYGAILRGIGTQYTLISIAAVIVGGGEFFGGVVSPIGTVIGSMIMLLTGSLLSFLNVSSAWQLSVQGVVLIAVLATRALVRRRAL